LEFRENITSDFAIVFTGSPQKQETVIVTEDFAERWGWFGVMHRLAKEDISKLEKITKLNLLECLTWLSYEIDLNSQNKVNTNYGS